MPGAVNIFSLMADTKHGGGPSFVAHLCMALRAQGYAPRLFRVMRRFEQKTRPWTHGQLYQDVTAEVAVGLADSAPSMIAYATHRTHAEQLAALVTRGVPIVFHAPAEFDAGTFAVLRAAGTKVGAIRKWQVQALQAQGLRASYVPHPYIRSYTDAGAPPSVSRPRHAICASRVDFCKRHDWIAEANAALPRDRRVEIWGSEGRMFAHHVLDKKWPRWRAQWRGPFSDGGARLYRQAVYGIDLTALTGSGDGGGTQYCMMESWDAGAALICNAAWARPGDSVRAGDNALICDGPASLIGLLSNPVSDDDIAPLVAAGRAELQHHTPAATVPIYMELMSR